MLAKQSGQSKATICRLTSYNYKKKTYHPKMETIQGISLALKLTQKERKELFYTAFPEFNTWDEASEKGYTVQQTDEMLYNLGLPTITREVKEN